MQAGAKGQKTAWCEKRVGTYRSVEHPRLGSVDGVHSVDGGVLVDVIDERRIRHGAVVDLLVFCFGHGIEEDDRSMRGKEACLVRI